MAIVEEIWPDKSLHIPVVVSTKRLGHTKAVSRQPNRLCYGTIIYFFVIFFLLMFLVILDHLENVFNFMV